MSATGSISYLCLQVTREGQASHAHVHEIISGLRRRGWSVELFEPEAPTTTVGAPGRLLRFLRTQWRLRSSRPDVVYIRGHFAAFPAALWARLRGLTVAQEVNGPYDDVFLAWPWTRRFAALFNWLFRRQLRWATVVFAVTPQLAEWVRREAPGAEVHVVPNGANAELFRPDATTDLELPARFVLFFGALAPWQGIDILLRAIGDPAWPAEVRLVVAGDGVRAPEVRAAAEQDRLTYLGALPYRRIPGIVARSLAGISAQTNPGGRSSTGLFPLKVFETLACGVPVIVSDFPGQADLIRENGCGLVVRPEDPTALAQAVARLHREADASRRMGRVARRLIEQGHSWDHRAGDTDRILRQNRSRA